MNDFEIVIFLMTILIVLSAFADKIKFPYAVLLVFIGLLVGFTPFLPNLKLSPDIVFLVFLPPLLYDAALRTSWLDFKKERWTISTLAVSLVFFTTTLVAIAAHYLIPGFTWPLAFLLGAIISPTDAVAASGVVKGLGLNKKVITIIEGESLLNDASALIAYGYALTATLTGSFILWKAALQFILVATGGVAAGFMIGFAMVFAHKKINDNPVVETSLSLLTPFLAYLLAEQFHVSGILAVVTAGIFISWRSREIVSFQTRLRATGVWDTVIFLLNGIIFILIGLQLPEIVTDLSVQTVYQLIGYGVIISVVTIIIRFIWVFAGAYHEKLTRKNKPGSAEELTDWKNVLIVAWTGTRGVVSLATALALPLTLANGEDFPKRHSILLLAFCVIFITLVVQALTLPLLIRMLKIKPVTILQQKEEYDLNLALVENSLEYINKDLPATLGEAVKEKLKNEYEFNYEMFLSRKGDWLEKKQAQSRFNSVSRFLEGQLVLIKFQRELLVKFQNDGTYSEETLGRVERELDIEELRLNTLLQRTATSARITGQKE